MRSGLELRFGEDALLLELELRSGGDALCLGLELRLGGDALCLGLELRLGGDALLFELELRFGGAALRLGLDSRLGGEALRLGLDVRFGGEVSRFGLDVRLGGDALRFGLDFRFGGDTLRGGLDFRLGGEAFRLGFFFGGVATLLLFPTPAIAMINCDDGPVTTTAGPPRTAEVGRGVPNMTSVVTAAIMTSLGRNRLLNIMTMPPAVRASLPQVSPAHTTPLSRMRTHLPQLGFHLNWNIRPTRRRSPSGPLRHFVAHLPARQPKAQEQRIARNDAGHDDGCSDELPLNLLVVDFLDARRSPGVPEFLVGLFGNRSLHIDLSRHHQDRRDQANENQHQPQHRPSLE